MTGGGALCDRKMPVRLSGETALVNGAETQATMKGKERRLKLNKMKMLMLMCKIRRKTKSDMNT